MPIKRMSSAPDLTPNRAANFAAALDRCRQELFRIASELPSGYGDDECGLDVAREIKYHSENVGSWAKFMWNVVNTLKQQET